MKPSLIKLQKFFKLEAERGYDNRAVLGGLSRMLEPWEAESRQDGLPEELITAVLSRLRDYNRLSPASRQEALQGLWTRIQSEMGASPISAVTESEAPQTADPPQAEIPPAPEKEEKREAEPAEQVQSEQPAPDPAEQVVPKHQAPEPVAQVGRSLAGQQRHHDHSRRQQRHLPRHRRHPVPPHARCRVHLGRHRRCLPFRLRCRRISSSNRPRSSSLSSPSSA